MSLHTMYLANKHLNSSFPRRRESRSIKQLDSRLRGNDEQLFVSNPANFQQRGFSLVTAIFLLVVLAGLGAMMVTFFTAQQQSSALDVLGSRAYQASHAGIEWGAYQVLPNSAAAFATSCRAGATAQTLPALAGTLADFSVSVNCSATSAVEAAATLWVYNITSTATRGTVGSADYVERQVQATIAQ